MMAPYRTAIVHPGACSDTPWSEKTQHSAAVDSSFSVIDLIRMQWALSQSVDRVPGPCQEPWR